MSSNTNPPDTSNDSKGPLLNEENLDRLNESSPPHSNDPKERVRKILAWMLDGPYVPYGVGGGPKSGK
jgi:hypothetical protein